MRKRYLLYPVVLLLCSLIGTSCSSSYLDREPAGGTIRQDQYEQLQNRLSGSLRGIYAMLNQYSSHDAFGERSIDMYSDILCGDMALTAFNYGYFYCDENSETNTDRTDYIWGHYYGMLHNINSMLRLIEVLPDTLSPSAKDAETAGAYAEGLTMRAYVLQQLLHFYCLTTEEVLHGKKNHTMATYPTFPIYTDKTPDNANPGYAHLADTYQQIENDLINAIRYFDAYAPYLTRQSKLAVNRDIAAALLAYSYLHKADEEAAPTDSAYWQPYQAALTYAKQVIAANRYSILPQSRVLKSGFNSIHEESWMWGQEVTNETSTGLGSFFGQVDIHSYSYAWAGDTKVIDKVLYQSIPEWDLRRHWWNQKNGTFYLCPDGKFYSEKNPTSTASGDIDRTWTSDNVLMRIESVYLMAAEAACRLGMYDEAKNYLYCITDQRADTSKTKAYEDWKKGLTDDRIIEAITLNWRVELWGEGYGLQTFRRLKKEVTRGSNHLRNAGKTERYDNGNYVIIIPSNEYLYNPSL